MDNFKNLIDYIETSNSNFLVLSNWIKLIMLVDIKDLSVDQFQLYETLKTIILSANDNGKETLVEDLKSVIQRSSKKYPLEIYDYLEAKQFNKLTWGDCQDISVFFKNLLINKTFEVTDGRVAILFYRALADLLEALQYDVNPRDMIYHIDRLVTLVYGAV